MSRKNKVNKTNYDQAGRLTPDDMARERKRAASGKPTVRQDAAGRGKATERIRGRAAGPAATRPRSAPEE